MKEHRLWSAETFSKNLRRYVEISGKTQKDIALDIGVTPASFNEWYKGKKYPRIDKIQRLADYFKISKSDLIEDKRAWEKPENADFHAKIIMDDELLDMIEAYYSLSEDDQQAIRLMTYALKNKKR